MKASKAPKARTRGFKQNFAANWENYIEVLIMALLPLFVIAFSVSFWSPNVHIRILSCYVWVGIIVFGTLSSLIISAVGEHLSHKELQKL